jgi:hypothetical protein
MGKKVRVIKLRKSDFENDLRDMGFDPEDFDFILEDHIEWYKSLPKTLELYRIVYSDSIDDINITEPGRHYSWDMESLIRNHTHVSGYGNNKYIMVVEADKRLIDVQETISNNIRYPNESEITLLHNGFGVEVLDIKQL